MSTKFLRNPVILIHGIDDTFNIFRTLAPYLTELGWQTYGLDLTPNNGSTCLDKLALQIERYIKQTFPPEQPIDLVGFSMGGLVSRYYVQRLGGIDRVQRFITISSPHNGTWIAYFRPNPGCHQMKPNSQFLQDLNQDVSMLERINFTSIWTPMDLMIFPASSSRLPVGKEVKIQVPSHPLMLIDPRSLRAVAEALSEPLRLGRQLEHTLLPQK